MDAPGVPGCLPRFLAAARSAARRSRRGGFRPGPSSELGGIEEFPLFRDSARSASSSCSRRSATIASSAAIRSPWTATWASCLSCSAIRSACSRISASRGSSGSGTSVTAANHPAGRRPPPRRHPGRRRNETGDHPAQLKRREPACVPSAVEDCADA